MLFLLSMIDLHCHSSFSDGELSPHLLFNKALNSKIRMLALTDHDTIAGLSALHQAAQYFDVMIINGIELSVRWKKYDIHIIGLRINPDEQGLCELIKKQNEGRISRAQQIAERLEECGVDNAYQKACDLAGHERVGRSHFAQILIQDGRARDFKEAFKRFLGQGRPAYVLSNWVDIEQAVATITLAGGQAVIAHPLKYRLTRSKLHELITTFKRAGGVGMEVISGAMTTAQGLEMAGLCNRFELLASTGSDYHGDGLSRISLGQQQPLPVNCVPIWHQWKDLVL
jgi:predicted metal-dependent phosphoesterase TrpH